jgi:hypothetical protein
MLPLNISFAILFASAIEATFDHAVGWQHHNSKIENCDSSLMGAISALTIWEVD